MLASITPLGERGRGNRFSSTVAAFLAGSLAGGLGLGVVLALLGRAVATAGSLSGRAAATVTALACVAAAALEAGSQPIPWLRRQVDERWLDTYRGWVYGAGFGAQLGFAVVTTVTTWALPAAMVAAVASSAAGRPGAAVVAGAAFGVTRALPVVAGARLHDPSRLRRRLSRVARAATPVRLAGSAALLFAAAREMAR